MYRPQTRHHPPRPQALQRAGCVEHGAKDFLNIADMFAYADFRTGVRLDIRRSGKVISVRVRFKRPLNLVALVSRIAQNS